MLPGPQVMVTGKPSWNVRMVPSCQPPKMTSTPRPAGMINGMRRRVHHLEVAELRVRTAGRLVPGSRRRLVVNLQPAQVHARRAEIGDLERRIPVHFSLHPERPLAHVRGPLIEL